MLLFTVLSRFLMYQLVIRRSVKWNYVSFGYTMSIRPASYIRAVDFELLLLLRVIHMILNIQAFDRVGL